MSMLSAHEKQNDADSSFLNVIKQKVANKAIKYANKDKPIFSGRGGSRFSWVFSFHDFFTDAEALDAFASEFWKHYASETPIQVGGLETSGIPLVIAILSKARELGLDCSGFFIRKERKTRALVRTIDGDLNDNPIVMVDDVFKSGITMERARVSLEQIGKKLESVCTILSFNRDTGIKWSNENSIPILSFFKLEDFNLKDAPPTINDPWDRRKDANINYEPLWSFAAPNPVPTNVCPKSTPLLIDSMIYFGSDSGIFWALDALTGDVIWNFDVNTRHEKGIWSSPAYHAGKVYFGAYNGNMYCLEAKTGEVSWVSPTCEWIGSSPLIISSHGKLIIGLEYAREKWKGGIAALDLETGEKIWEHQLTRFQHGSAEFYEEQNLVIVGSSDHAILALDVHTGSLVWESKTQRSIKYPPAICSKHKIVATASFDGGIRMNSLVDGEEIFKLDTADICYSTPLILGDFVYCGSGDSNFYIIDIKKRELVKTIITSGRIYGGATVVNGNVIFGNTAGVLEEINSTSFETEQAILLPDAITNKVLVSHDQSIIYVMTYLSEIFAMRRNKCTIK